MNIQRRRAMVVMIGGATYPQKIRGIFGSNLIALFTLSEPAGLVAYDSSGNGLHGAYSAAGVTYGQTGIGNGATSVLLAGGYAPILTAGLGTAFNPLEFSVIVFGKVSAAGVWTDTARRNLMTLGVDANNYISLEKPAADNQVGGLYVAGGTGKSSLKTAVSASGFFSVGMTVSKSNDRLIGYYNGSAIGAAVTGLGIWAGSLVAARCNVGVRIAAATEPWSGYAANCIIINGEATAGQMLAAGAPLS